MSVVLPQQGLRAGKGEGGCLRSGWSASLGVRQPQQRRNTPRHDVTGGAPLGNYRCVGVRHAPFDMRMPHWRLRLSAPNAVSMRSPTPDSPEIVWPNPKCNESCRVL